MDIRHRSADPPCLWDSHLEQARTLQITVVPDYTSNQGNDEGWIKWYFHKANGPYEVSS
jgi:hypothetical protein